MNKLCLYVGDCGIDYYTDLNIARPGGCAWNFAHHFSRLNPLLKTSVLTSIGSSKISEEVRRVLLGEAFSCEFFPSEGKPPVQQLSIGKDGDRHFGKYTNGALQDLNPMPYKRILEKANMIASVLFKETKHFVLPILEEYFPGKIALDFNTLGDFGENTAIVESLVDKIDIGFFGLQEQQSELIAKLRQMAKVYNKIFVVTLGEKGSITFNGNNAISHPGYKALKVLDTTGAGDTFMAGFCHSFLNAMPIEACIDKGHRLASEKVGSIGGFPSPIQFREI